MSTAKVLVTGSSGFLGHTIVRDFKDSFGQIIGVSRSSRNLEGSHKQYALDVCSEEFIDVVIENDPTAIIHTAAKSIVRDCELNPKEAFMQNVQGTINVLEAARRLKSDIPIIVLETDKVYGQQPAANIPTNENHPLLGFSPYEYSKVMAANVCNFYRQYYGLRIYSLRPANLYGYWDGNLSRIVPNTFNKIQNGEEPTIFTDSLTQEREYLYVDDLVECMLGLINKNAEPGAYNVSSGQIHTPQEVIRSILKVSGIELPIKYIEKPYKFTEIKNQALSGEKLNKVLGEPKYHNLSLGLEKIWNRIQESKHGI